MDGTPMVLDLCDETHDVMIVMMVVDGGGGGGGSSGGVFYDLLFSLMESVISVGVDIP